MSNIMDRAMEPIEDSHMGQKADARLGIRRLCHLLHEKFRNQGIEPGRDGLFDYLRLQQLI